MRTSPTDPTLLAEARGRLAKMLVVGEQLSLDRGSWLQAQELMWEEDPPYASFGARGTDQFRRPYPRAAPLFWIEVAIRAVKDLDDWTQKRMRSGRAQACVADGFPQGGAGEEGAKVSKGKGRKRKGEKQGSRPGRQRRRRSLNRSKTRGRT